MLITKFHTWTDYDADIVPSHISAERLNTNFDRLYDLVNGNLDNYNSATNYFFTQSQATKSTWVAADEGRFIYTQDTEKIYFGNSTVWKEIQFVGGATTAHDILSSSHGDTIAASPVAGDIIYANATPKWTKLAKGTDGHVLTLSSGLPIWSAAGAGVSTFVALTDTPANYTSQAKKLLVVNETPDEVAFASNAEWDETNDRLNITSVNAHGITTTRTTTEINTAASAMRVKRKTSNNMTDGFGVTLVFSIEDSGAVDNVIGKIQVTRSGAADNTGLIELQAKNSGSYTAGRMVSIDYKGNLQLGKNAYVGNAMTNGIVLSHGIKPDGDIGNDTCVIYGDLVGATFGYPHFRGGDGKVIKLYQQGHIPNTAGDDATVVNQILVVLENLGLLATS